MALSEPLIIVNCKTYSEDPGALGLKVARAAVKVREQIPQVCIAVAVPATDVFRVSSAGLVPVLSEHVDSELPGAHTGSITVEDLRANGALGSLINHSENPESEEEIVAAIKRLSQVKMASVVCAKTPVAAAKFAQAEPSYVAMEPPELIGGDISVSSAHPELIVSTVSKVQEVAGNKVPVLVGAGVKNEEDVRVAQKLGSVGILVASGVTKADNIENALLNLAKGLL